MTSCEQPGLFPDGESSPAASPARSSRWRDSARAWVAHAQGCSGTSCGWPTNCAHAGSFLRTSPVSCRPSAPVPVTEPAWLTDALWPADEWRGDRDDPRVWFPDVPHNPGGGACPGGCMAAHGGAMGTVLGALGERGYGFAYRVLDAQFFGVPQRRDRVFIAGCLGDRAAPVQVLLEPESGEGNPAPRRAARARATRASGGGAVCNSPGWRTARPPGRRRGAAGGHLIPEIALSSRLRGQ